MTVVDLLAEYRDLPGAGQDDVRTSECVETQGKQRDQRDDRRQKDAAPQGLHTRAVAEGAALGCGVPR